MHSGLGSPGSSQSKDKVTQETACTVELGVALLTVDASRVKTYSFYTPEINADLSFSLTKKTPWFKEHCVIFRADVGQSCHVPGSS